MSNKERIVELLDSIPDYKMGYVLAYVQGVAADEEADDNFLSKNVGELRERSGPRKRIKHILSKSV